MSLWVIVDDSIAVDELLAGAGAAALAAFLADLVTHQAATRFRMRAGWLVPVLSLPGQVTRDTVVVFAALWRRLVRGEQPPSGFRETPARFGGTSDPRVSAAGLARAAHRRLRRRGQVTERFTNALERLGSSELYVRIGGVHALEHVMRDSASHHDDVVEVLAAFIRDRVPATHHQLGSHAWMHPVTASVDDLPPQPEPDVQAALTALAQRPRRPERRNIDLTGLHLTRAQLGGAGLTGAELVGANLTHAWLRGANLTRADLGFANLTRAQLSAANLTRAQFGADPPGVPAGWIVIDRHTGELAPAPAQDT